MATKWDRWLYETGVNYLKFWIKDFGQWILLAAGDTHVADPLDTMHHEMDSIIHSHHAYKSVWLPIIGEQLIQERSPLANLHNEIAVVVIKGFSGSEPYSVVKLFMGHIVLYYTKGSVVCKITGRRRNRKGLEVPCKNIYYRSTKDTAFIIVITWFPHPLMRSHAYKNVCNLT